MDAQRASHVIDWLILVALGVAIYVARIDALSVRGEESRRIRISCEMLERGDWFVQTEQGQTFTERPPLCNWLLMLAIMAAGPQSIVVCRLISAAATMLTAGLLYAHARRVTSRLGALTAAVAFLTMGQVLQLGSLAENEAVMTLFMSGALLLWEWGYRCRWPATRTWCLGYALAALATLTKGIQGPAYFIGSTWLMLLVERDRRFFFSRAHVAGIAVFLLVLGIWQVPYACLVGVETAVFTWTHEVFKKTSVIGIGPFVKHALAFPFEVLVSTAPWSIWLLPLVDRRVRAAITGQQRQTMRFLGCVAAVGVPTVWFACQGRARYLMPLFPCAATMIGIVVDRVVASQAQTWQRRVWKLILFGAASLTITLGLAAWALVGLPAEALAPKIAAWIPVAKLHLAVYGGLALALAWMLWRAARSTSAEAALRGVLASAAILGLSYAVPIVDLLGRWSCPTAEAVEQLKARLPEQAQLVSLDRVHHLFQYYYEQQIPRIDRRAAAGCDFEYFCIDRTRNEPLELGFAWEPVATICCDRNSFRHEMYVVVGRRTDKLSVARRPN
jgi:4-amino-4-deoxy-L-arabinose transferase-like glycosyltransferase